MAEHLSKALERYLELDAEARVDPGRAPRSGRDEPRSRRRSCPPCHPRRRRDRSSRRTRADRRIRARPAGTSPVRRTLPEGRSPRPGRRPRRRTVPRSPSDRAGGSRHDLRARRSLRRASANDRFSSQKSCEADDRRPRARNFPGHRTPSTAPPSHGYGPTPGAGPVPGPRSRWMRRPPDAPCHVPGGTASPSGP